MKPLTASALSGLFERFDHGKGAELRHITPLGPTTIELTLSLQDKNRGYDWVDLALEISGVTDAKLLDDNRFGFLDTDDGLSVIITPGQVGFGIGAFETLTALTAAALYLVGSSIKYEERPFSV